MFAILCLYVCGSIVRRIIALIRQHFYLTLNGKTTKILTATRRHFFFNDRPIKIIQTNTLKTNRIDKMSLRPNRASSGAAAPNYGGYAGTPGGYSAPGYGAGGGASYYQQPPGAGAPYTQPSYGGSSYGGGGGYNPGGGTGGYGTGGGGGSSQGSYGGYSGGTPVYTGAPTSPAGSFKNKPKKKKYGYKDPSNMVALLLGALSILFMVTTLHFRGKCNQVMKKTRTKSITEALNQIQMDIDKSHELQMEKNAASRTERTLNRRIADLEGKVKSLKTDLEEERELHSTVSKDFEVHREEIGHHTERLTNRDEAWADTVDVLQAYTKRESKRQALER